MTKTTKRRIAFWGTVGLALAAALVIMTRPQPVPVDFAVVSRGPMAETLDHEGRTRVRERYVVSAPVAGRVLRIELRPGDRVVANQTVIATFAPGASSLLDARSRAGATSHVSGAEALLEQARAQRDLARVQSQHAKEERDRAQNLSRSRRRRPANARLRPPRPPCVWRRTRLKRRARCWSNPEAVRQAWRARPCRASR
jgi:HlyD family secretion protein